ncbi:MAG: hypothetical protein AAGB25_04540 [Pseudomonadota bacterium]
MKSAIVSSLAAAALLAPQTASAQIYQDFHEACRGVSDENRLAGALMGGVIGGFIGNGVAADGVRDEGSVLGALLGAAAGAEIARNSADCDPTYYGPDRHGYDYRSTEYSRINQHPDYDDPSGVYGQTAPYSPTSVDVYDDQYAENDAKTDDYHLYGNNYEGYGSDRYEPAAVECETVKRITRLPDGSELHEPVRACRKAYYGDWSLDE